MISRRAMLMTALASGLGGCIQSPVVVNAFEVARSEIFGYPDAPLSRQQISAIPLATMAARVGRGPEAILILGRVQGREQHWISGIDRSVLVLRGGRVVKTFGFPENLRQTTDLADDPVNRLLHKLDKPLNYVRQMDLEKHTRNVVTVDSILEPVGTRKIVIREIEFDTLLVRETNQARGVQWSFENLYWVDPGDGFIWKSQQYVARSFPPVNYEILKPPS